MSDRRAPLLDVRELTVNFGGTKALDGLTLGVPDGTVTGIIGPNGAGKSTLFNAISGLVRISSGSVRLGGVELSHVASSRVPSLGLGRTFQHTRLLETEDALTNVLVGAIPVTRWSMLRPSVKRARMMSERARSLLDVVGIHDVHTKVSEFSYASQRVIEIARALMCEPRLLLLDEPTAGMTSEERATVATYIDRINVQLGVTVVVIEHDVQFVSAVSSHMIAMVEGRQLCEGTPDEVLSHRDVVSSYLGTQ